MALSMNRFLDLFKQKELEKHGDTAFRDHVMRAENSYQDVLLSATQMDTINATPVTLIAAPGSGLTNIVTGVYFKVNSTGFTPFELGSGVMEIRYTDGSGAKVITDITNAVVEGSTDAESWNPAILAVPVSNAAIVAHTSTDVTAGTGNIQMRIFYKTVKVSEIVA